MEKNQKKSYDIDNFLLKLIRKEIIGNILKPILNAVDTSVFILLFISFFITNLYPSLSIITTLLGILYAIQLFFLKRISYKTFEESRFKKLVISIKTVILILSVLLLACFGLIIYQNHIPEIQSYFNENIWIINIEKVPKNGKMPYIKCFMFILAILILGLIYIYNQLKIIRKKLTSLDNSPE